MSKRELDTKLDEKNSRAANAADYFLSGRASNLRWIAFMKPKAVFGFDHLSPISVPQMTSKLRGFSVNFEKILGWRPPHALNTYLVAERVHEFSIQLSFSMFHLNSGSFFGSTWLGSPVIIPTDTITDDGAPVVIDIDYNEIIYLMSRLTDPSCVGVVELVASKIGTQKSPTTSQYG